MSKLSVKECVHTLQNKKPIIVFDDENEQEGDICFPSVELNEQHLSFLMNKCKGIICTTLSYDRVEELGIPVLSKKGENMTGSTNFVIPLDHIASNTGISAADRLMVIKEVVECVNTDNLVWPGHQNFLRVSKDGIYERQGHTETCQSLIELAGYTSATICELVDNAGVPRDYESVRSFAVTHDIGIIHISDIKAHFSTITCTPAIVVNEADSPHVLRDQTFVVTGSSSGIGRAVKVKLRELGGTVICMSRTEGTDISDVESVRAALRDVGAVNGIIHCAGHISTGHILECGIDTFQQHLQTNVWGVINVIKEVESKLVKDAVVVAVSSNAIYSKEKKERWGLYVSSKQMLSCIWGFLTRERADLIFYEVSPSKTYTNMISALYPDIDRSACMAAYSVADVISSLIVNKVYNASGCVFHLKHKTG